MAARLGAGRSGLGGIVLAVMLVWQLRAGDDCVPTNTNGC
jgi:hypothetical protein